MGEKGNETGPEEPSESEDPYEITAPVELCEFDRTRIGQYHAFCAIEPIIEWEEPSPRALYIEGLDPDPEE